MKQLQRTVSIVAICYGWMVPSSDAAPFGASLARRYDQNTYLASHNAFANAQDLFNPALANQIPGITAQLESGVRCLLLDVYFLRQRVNYVLGLPNNMESEIYENVRDYLLPSDAFAGSPVEIVLAHGAKKPYAGYTLLAGFPFTLIRYRNLISALDEIKTWMDAHPNEVVTIVLESYVPESNEIDAYLGSTGLSDMVFLPHIPNAGMLAPDGQRWYVPFHGWPKLQEMVRFNKRLVIFSNNGTRWSRYSGRPIGPIITPHHDGQAYQWDFMVENEPGQDGIDGGVDNSRSESAALDNMSYPLTFMNWFPSLPVQSVVAALNQPLALSPAAYAFETAARRAPNFIAVDHYHLGGGPQIAVTEYNLHWERRASVSAKLTVTPAPNPYGWRSNAIVTAASSTDAGVQINYYWYGGNNLGAGEEVAATGMAENNFVRLQPYTKWTNAIPSEILATNDGIFHFSAEAVTPFGDRSYREFVTLSVDGTPPVVGPVVITRPPDSAAGWYNHPLTLSVTVRDLVSGAAVAWWTKANGERVMSDSYYTVPHPQQISRVFEFPYAQEGSAFVQFFSRDFADNVSSSGSGFYTNVIQLDMKPPTTSVGVSSMKNGVVVTLSAIDTLSGVTNTWYRLDGAAWGVYTAPFIVAGTNVHTLEFYSRDRADNQEPIRTFYLNRAAVSLTSSQNPSYLYQLLELTAQVVFDSSGLTPTGMVTFLDGTNLIGKAKLGTNGLARMTNSPIDYILDLGVHSITARYDGGATFGSAFSQTLTQRVARPSGVRLTVSTNRLVETQPLVLTAEILPEGGFVATGAVAFEIDRESGGQLVSRMTVPLDANGRATCSTTQLPAGTYALYASYSGDNNVPPAPYGSAVLCTVEPGQMFVSVSSSPPERSVAGEPVTFTITVTRTLGAPPASNTTLRFEEFDEPLQTLTLGSSNSTSFTTSSLGVGEHFFLITADSVPQLSGGIALYQYHVDPAADVPPYFRGISKNAGGAADLQIDAQPGRGVLVEYSTHLPNWHPLTVATNTGDLLRVTDFDATNNAVRFYRAQVLR
jgi:hypothetical protein